MPNNSESLQVPRTLSSWLFAASFFYAPLSDLQVVEHVSICDVLLVAAALIALIERAVFREPIIIPLPYMAVWLVFTLTLLMNLPTDGTEYWKSYAVTVIAAVFTPVAIVLMRVKNIGQMKFMLFAWTLGGLFGAGFILAYCNGYFTSHIDRFWRYHERARGLTHHPNLSGLGCFLTLPGLLLLLSSNRNLIARICALVLIVLVLKALDYTGTRSALVGAFILLASWLFLTAVNLIRIGALNRNHLGIGLISLLVFCSGVLIYSMSGGGIDVLSRVWTRLFAGDHFAQHSLLVRDILNRKAEEGFLDNPLFGGGFQWVAFSQSAVSHNIYLNYLQATGIFGLLGFTLTLLYPLIYPAKIFLQRPSESIGTINNVLLAAALSMVAWLFAQSGAADYEVTLLFALMLHISVWKLYPPRPINT